MKKVKDFLFRWLNRLNYYGGFGTIIAAFAALATLIFIWIQTTEIKTQVKPTKDQLKLTEQALNFTNRQIQISLAAQRPFLYIWPFRNNSLTQ